MSQEQIIEVLKKLLLDLGKPKVLVDDVKLTSNIKLDLGLDSFALVYLMFQLQNQYGIDTKNVKPSDFVTVSDFVNFLKDKI